ncbi:hypothetical protein [Nocardioides euryhalodurans]|uniref:Uncharacterized protein n=1 Tax=Nocardioides euryhalodurans TaxID=2518370 RepID=A0A4P7GNC2_9ACTN|nr:hypothetical protein [Nocardioides euryhalodurans]QBR93281.1 hypothetical protein EXE57_14175 [Nocardioides euryhalodurans]
MNSTTQYAPSKATPLMAQPASWIPIAISAGALAVSVAVAVRTEMRNRRVERKAEELEQKQQLTDVRQTLERLINRWRSSHLNEPYVVTDENWRALLDSVKSWRDDLQEAETNAIAYTETDKETKTRAFWLLAGAVEAAKTFEWAVQPIVEQWESHSKDADPYEEKLKVEAAIRQLQAVFRDSFEALDEIRGENLIRPAKLEQM